MNGWDAIVLCTSVISTAVVVVSIIEAKVKQDARRESAASARSVTIGLFDNLQSHVCNIDQTMTRLLLANRELLDSLPDEDKMKRALKGISDARSEIGERE